MRSLINTLLKEYGQYTGCANGCKRGKVEVSQEYMILFFMRTLLS